MRKYTNNSLIQYALVAFLAIALLFGQAFKFHMHLQHDGIPSPATAHIIDVHASSLLYEMSNDKHDDVNNHHHTAEIDISLDSVANKIQLLTPIVLLFLIASIFLFAPLLSLTSRFYIQKNKPTSLNLLLSPPLRAPPAN